MRWFLRWIVGKKKRRGKGKTEERWRQGFITGRMLFRLSLQDFFLYAGESVFVCLFICLHHNTGIIPVVIITNSFHVPVSSREIPSNSLGLCFFSTRREQRGREREERDRIPIHWYCHYNTYIRTFVCMLRVCIITCRTLTSS